MRTLLLTLLFSPALANALNTWGTDMSDLWWNRNESGWGVNVAHQRDVVFATFFVYGSDNRTRWYVAPAMASQSSATGYVFSGTLYETQGPFLGGPFNPALVANRQVGTARLTFPTISEGTLTYTVDGVSVSKQIQRQTFRRAEITGSYAGAAIATVTGCAGSGSYQATAQFSVTLSASNNIVVSALLDNGGRCSYSGTYFQEGRMGSVVGTFACTGNIPTAGTFEAFEMEAGYSALVMRYEARYGTCFEEGRIGGIRP